MTPTSIPLLQLMLLASIVGFIVFCASYAVLVWKKRHQSSGAAGVRTRLRRWSMTGVVLGSLGLMITLVARQAIQADGKLGGDNLYPVRASGDMRVVQLAKEGPVKEGDILARFSSATAAAEINHAELTCDQLRNEREYLPTRPLTLDPEVVRLHTLAEQRVTQLTADLAGKRNNRATESRSYMQPIIVQRDKLAANKSELKLAEGELKQVQAKLGPAQQQLARERELSKKLNVATNDLNDREKEVGALQVDVIRFEARVAAKQEEVRISQASLEELERKAAAQDATFKAEEEKLTVLLAAAETAKAKALRDLEEDKKLALERRKGETGDQEFKLRQAEVHLASTQNKLEVKAPYSGMIVYTNPSPGAALTNGPLLVMCPADGLRFLFRLSDQQVEALRNAGTLMVELPETADTLEQRFPGKFLKATPLAREPNMSMAELACEMPPEMAASLADGKTIKARISWRPPLLQLYPFLGSAVLFGLGVFGLIIVNVAGWRPNWPKIKKPVPLDDDDVLVSFARSPAPREGDTVESVAADNTIPVRPEMPNVPRERPVQPWEHPVGVRLREAIIREDLTSELLDAVEVAIEHQKDAVIVPMREAMRRAPTVPDHVRKLLDKLNTFDSNDEFKVIEKRCLAQRLTFLLYTLGMEIPSQSSNANPSMARVAGS
jgi:multidrug resistance efflux pump